jgi:hypothetical protein
MQLSFYEIVAISELVGTTLVADETHDTGFDALGSHYHALLQWSGQDAFTACYSLITIAQFTY